MADECVEASGWRGGTVGHQLIRRGGLRLTFGDQHEVAVAVRHGHGLQDIHVARNILFANTLKQDLSIGADKDIRGPTVDLVLSGRSAVCGSVDANADEILVERIHYSRLAQHALLKRLAG
jgi:hypothetical protein